VELDILLEDTHGNKQINNWHMSVMMQKKADAMFI